MPRKLLFCVLLLPAWIFTAASHAQTHAVNGEFITEWLLLGPFSPNDLDKDFLTSVGGEANIHPKEDDTVITALQDTLRWKHYRSPGSIIHFDHAIGPYEFVTVYAFCVLQSEKQRRVQFLVGSNDEIAVWINGQQVHRHSVVRGVNVDDDVFTAELNAGENTCLVKITNETFTWGFSMRAFPEDQPVAATPKMHLWAGRFQIKGNRFVCDANWKYHPGDDPESANPEIDDRLWKTVRSVVPPHQWPEDWRGIGWFRLHLSVDSTLWNRPLAMNVWQWGASEIYLDGKLLAQYGKVGSSINDEDGYAVLNPDLSLPNAIVFDRNTDHVLAVRYSNFFLLQKKAPNLLHGFQVNLRELDSAIAASAEQRESNTKNMVITTSVPMVFAVLHLLLFLFYRRARENLYYAILMLTIGAASFFASQYKFSFVADLRQAFLYNNLGQILVLFSALATLRFLYAIFYPRLPKQFWLFLFTYIAVLIWIWDNPFHTEDYANWFATTTLLEMLRIVVVAILKKKDGAWIIGTGISFMTVLFGASIILTGMGILPQTSLFEVTLPGIGIAGLLLSMSVYLAWDFARTSKNLEAQLVQVKALSEKTLQQQLEQARLQQELELEHLQAEKLQEIDRMKSRFFANISHEFRTPLTLILGPLEKMLSENFHEPVKRQFRVMLRNGRRLLRLINQLLDLAKLEAGSMSLKARPENIVQLLKGIVLSFSSLAERKQIALKFHAPEESIIAYVDRDKLEKIVSNLLSNAFKFTPEGGSVAVAVGRGQSAEGIEQRAEGGGLRATGLERNVNDPRPFAFSPQQLELSVRDTGIGIPPDKLEKIFDRFYQADDSYTREQEGSGIGLALTKELVELHHGEIQVTSELGKGSTFFVCLPLGKEHLKPEEIVEDVVIEQLPVISGPTSVNLQVTSEQDTDSPSIQQSIDPSIQAQATSGQQPIILVVEDNADVRAYIRDYLEKDYQIIEAVDGEAGFEESASAIPDLIISDVMMPKMDGYELCRKLKTDERTSHIPVILLTARAGGESKVEGLETGADDYIIKPFDARELQVRVKNLIEQRRKLRERFRQEITLQPKEIAITSMDEQFLQKAMAAVEKNLPDPEFSTDDFARQVAMSRMQLHRKLRALTDQSTHEFIRTYRLQRAAQLLQNHAGTVSEICYDVGFNSLSHFAKAFREQFGQSPSEYAERFVEREA